MDKEKSYKLITQGNNPNKTQIEFKPTADHPEVHMNPRQPLLFPLHFHCKHPHSA